jgi:serine/threonine protein kinase/tetratricopeptide (TPR) repeat protein
MEEATRAAERLAEDWRHGLLTRAEEMLEALPHLAADPEAAVRIIYEEVCQRQERGQEASPAELAARFPQWQDELAVLLDCHRLMGLVPAGPRFPEPGEVLGEFRILAEIGRGALGRVCLAEDTALAGRLMMLKLTPRVGQEHLSLARLQHTHIVPLYFVHDFPDRGLRELCMPCLGGASLQQVLSALAGVPPEQRSGRHILDALEAAAADPRLFWEGRGPNRRFLERATYVQAVCWIGSVLADALHYAHEQGLVHLDVKPSNVLLTADFQPMLLDFHMARPPVRPGGTPGWFGGTTGYMSPEQRAAWHAFQARLPVEDEVGPRSDVYSLGLLLHEMLYGGLPEEGARTPPRREGVSTGLRDILARCLRRDLRQRYPSAGTLAEDLRRHLSDRPLTGVRNRDPVEAWRKWHRHHPHAILMGCIAALAVVAAATLWLSLSALDERGRREASAAITHGRELMRLGQYGDAAVAFRGGLDGLGGRGGPLAAELREGMERASAAGDVQALHEAAEQCRYLHGEELRSPITLRRLEARLRPLWEARARLLSAQDKGLPPALAESLPRDLADVAVLWSRCRAGLAPPGGDAAAREEAAAALAEAEALLGPSPALDWEGRRLSARPGTGPPPRTAWEHYALGRSLLDAGELGRAAEAFSAATEQRPQDFWPWYGRGVCASRRGLHAEAAAAFSVCIALSPGQAACYHNRAHALAAAGDTEAALRDYGRALSLDPALAASALDRGALHLREGRLVEAEADLVLALRLGASPVAAHYNLALVHQARGEEGAALSSVERALAADPSHGPSRSLKRRLTRGGPGHRD